MSQELDETPEDERRWARLRAAFDAEDEPLPTDRATTERLLGRLLGELPLKPKRSRPRLGVLLVAAALCLASVAAATVLGLRQRGLPSEPNAAVHSASAMPHAPAPTSLPLPTPASSASAADVPSAAAPTPATPLLADSAMPSPALPSAAELFSAAGRARREGDTGRARAALETLQARFPGSPEAAASDVSLGMLLLKGGSTTAARRHFERYLARSPGGALAPDALWGRAEALAAEGNRADARAVLTGLLARYPSSAYASAARAKLRAP